MADFDPHAFVAGDDFDPHAFVGEQPTPPMHINREKLMALREKTRKAAEDAPSHLSLEENSRAFAGPALAAADTASFGALGAVMRALANSKVPGPGMATEGARAIDEYRRDFPALSMWSTAPAYMIGGPERAATAVERLLPEATSAVGKAARATVASGLSSGVTAGAESAFRGDPIDEVGREAGRGYVGGTAIGAPLSAASLAMQLASKAILGSKGAEARRFLESRGQPLTAPDTSDAAIGAAAQRTDESVKKRMAGYKQEVASGPYMEEVNKIAPERAGGLIEVSDVYHNLAKAEQDPANLQVVDKLEKLRKMLEGRQVATPDGGHVILMTEKDLNGLRQSLAGIAGVGESNAPKLSPLKAAYDQVKGIVDQGPYKEANRRHAEGMRDFTSSLDMVGLEPTYDQSEPIKGNLRVASQRQGQNTVTAGADNERLDIAAFKAKHPELANVIDAPEIIRKQGDLSFHAAGPSHGGLIDRVVGHMPLPVILAAAAAGHGLKGMAAAAAAMAYQNRNALAGRVLFTPAERAQLEAQLMLEGIPHTATPGREVTTGIRQMQEKR